MPIGYRFATAVRTDTAGWEYRYHGHLLPSGAGLLATVVDRPKQLKTCSRLQRPAGWRDLAQCGARYAHYLGLDLSANANASSLAASAISVSPKRPKRPALM
jgi:hypothetical protein